MPIRPRRSVLYMPGSNARALEKAKTLAADALILDLEDAVAPDAKDLAREQVVEAVKAGGYGKREIVVRVNGLGTPWGEADLKAAIAAAPMPFSFLRCRCLRIWSWCVPCCAMRTLRKPRRYGL